MPIYEYKCNSCGTKFERIEKFSDAPLETHEDCGGAVERLLSAPALQFKGTGWYVTDYARSNGSSSSHSESTKESKSESKSDSSSSSTKGSDTSSSSTTNSNTTTPSSDKK
jgi:putative FmdB family regulatory protein